MKRRTSPGPLPQSRAALAAAAAQVLAVRERIEKATEDLRALLAQHYQGGGAARVGRTTYT